jgi:Ran GTPase-activating protein (RanGAP) involved in mRNA processing and transport
MNNTIVHIDLGCNQISGEGAEFLFRTLINHQSIVSINMANTDCYKNKNKLGTKGAICLGQLIQ